MTALQVVAFLWILTAIAAGFIWSYAQDLRERHDNCPACKRGRR